MSIQDRDPGVGKHLVYYPRFAAAKLLLALLGVALIGASFEKLGPLLKLAFAGGSARAEAVRVVRTEAGGRESSYISDAEVLTAQKAMEDQRDYVSVFWVEYRFTTSEGKVVEARSPIGRREKPLHPLRDQDGLPSMMRVWYDHSNPQMIALPSEFLTWFLPGMLVLFGSAAVAMGLLLWWHANKPIEMPDLSQTDAGAAPAHG